MYFMISVDEDGDVRIEAFGSKEALERTLDQMVDGVDEKFHPRFRSPISWENDPQQWGSSRYMVIKGEVVQPTPERVVLKGFKVP